MFPHPQLPTKLNLTLTAFGSYEFIVPSVLSLELYAVVSLDEPGALKELSVEDSTYLECI